MTTLLESLNYQPTQLAFGTSGLRGLVSDMTDLECYINALGFIEFLKEKYQLSAGATIYIAGDLRTSTLRIMGAVHQAITDSGYISENCGLIPTPALMHYALQKSGASIMVTGSHIPADRNGVKFNTPDGEVLKGDEKDINAAVAVVRERLYSTDLQNTLFDQSGSFTAPPSLPEVSKNALTAYKERYLAAFSGKPFSGKKIIFYQHSSVGRDVFVDILKECGAEVVPVGRSDTFVPIDTENVTKKDQEYFKGLAREHPDAFAIISTDGDSDRPFVVDENGIFHRGDVVGAIVALWLGTDFAAIPISSSDAVNDYLADHSINYIHTKIGSPYVIAAMQEAADQGKSNPVGWEVNGGFLLGEDCLVGDTQLAALPTRDAALPIFAVLMAAIQEECSLSRLFAKLPARFTQAGLVDNFPIETSLGLMEQFSKDTEETYTALENYFTSDLGFGEVRDINAIDGIRITFSNGDIAHLRSSRNAPQLRIYSVAASQERADEIVELAIAEPNGIIRAIERDFANT